MAALHGMGLPQLNPWRQQDVRSRDRFAIQAADGEIARFSGCVGYTLSIIDYAGLNRCAAAPSHRVTLLQNEAGSRDE